MEDLKARLNSCYAPQYIKINDLGPNVPYKIVQFAKVQTRYGETIRATIAEGINGDDVVLLNVYLPHRFLTILSDTAIENYNKGAGDRLSLMYRGVGKGIEFV